MKRIYSTLESAQKLWVLLQTDPTEAATQARRSIELFKTASKLTYWDTPVEWYIEEFQKVLDAATIPSISKHANKH